MSEVVIFFIAFTCLKNEDKYPDEDSTSERGWWWLGFGLAFLASFL